MQKQKIEFAVQRKNGVIQKVGRSSILQPQINFKGGTVKWYTDKPKKEGANHGR